MDKIAKFFSFILHPFFMPLIALLVIFNSETHLSEYPTTIQFVIYGVVFVCTCLFPLLCLPIFYMFGFIDTYHLHNRSERILPLFISVIGFYINYLLFKRFVIPIDFFIQHFLLISSLTAIFTLAINYWWKISLHMIGIGSLTGLLCMYSYEYSTSMIFMIITVIIFSILLALARLKLKAHTNAQIYAGYLLGLLTMIVGYGYLVI